MPPQRWRRWVFIQKISQKYQKFLDNVTPYTFARWLAALILILAYLSRVFIFLEGWYLVTYALGLHYLNLLLEFLTPVSDPEIAECPADDQMPGLPIRQDDEFRPFIRRLPEFKCWCAVIKCTLFALFITLFEVFNIPACWRILLFYFIILLSITMRQRIKHMIKYRYIPFTRGKPKYQSDDSSANSNTVPK